MGKAKNVKISDLNGFVFGLIAIISGILASIFEESYMHFIFVAIGIILVGIGAYNLALKKYVVEIIEIAAGVTLIFLAIYELEIAYILLGVAIMLICMAMLGMSIKRKDKNAKAAFMYLIIALGIVAGSLLISIPYVYAERPNIFIGFGVVFAVQGLLMTTRSFL